MCMAATAKSHLKHVLKYINTGPEFGYPGKVGGVCGRWR